MCYTSWQMYYIVCKYIPRCSRWEKAHWLGWEAVNPGRQSSASWRGSQCLGHTDCGKQKYLRRASDMVEVLWLGKLYHCHEILLRVPLLEDALCSWVFSLEMGQSSKVKLQWNHWGMAEPAMHAHPLLVPLRVSISIYICNNFPILSPMLVTVCMFDLGRKWLRTMWVRVQLISRVHGGSWALGGFKSPLSWMWTKCFGQRESEGHGLVDISPVHGIFIHCAQVS